MRWIFFSIVWHVSVILLWVVGSTIARTLIPPTPYWQIAQAPVMRVDVLGLPEFEAYVARHSPPTPEPPKEVTETAPVVLPATEPKKISPKPKPKQKELSPAQRDSVTKENALRMLREQAMQRLRLRAGNRLQRQELEERMGQATAPHVSDPFWEILRMHITDQWKVHPRVKSEGVSVRFSILVAPHGKIVQSVLIRPSTSSEYDAFVQSFIANTLWIDLEIPDRFKSYLEQYGVEVEFEP